MLLRKPVSTCIFILLFIFTNAQSNVIDIAEINNYDDIAFSFHYFRDNAKKFTINDVNISDFKPTTHKKIFDPQYPGGNYFARITLINTGINDTIFFYTGKGQNCTVYEYDSATGRKVLLNNRIKHFSQAVFNNVPFTYLCIDSRQRKIILLECDINFYNWNLFDPALVKKDKLDFFIFDHILQPSRIYIFIALFLLGIMMSMFVNTFAFFFRTPSREYLYYSVAILVFLLYFSLRILDVFAFSRWYYWLYEFRFETFQLFGSMLILKFISHFLQLKQQNKKLHNSISWMIHIQTWFLIINIPFAYTNRYNYMASIAFDVMRLLVLLFSMSLTIYLVVKYKTKEVQYIGTGSIISIVLSMIALYIGRKINNQDILLRYNKIPSLIFNFGILWQMLLFLQALAYRRRMQEAERIRAVEQLQIENDRKELETYKAIIEARDNERTRISQEIHDDIGSGLTSIRLLSEIAKVKNSGGDKKELEKISATSNVLMDKMNEIIWTLNSRNDTLQNLIAYLRHQIVEFFEPSNIILEINLPENVHDAPLSGNVRRNIILSVKEALHNIVKHSQASVVTISFSFDKVFIISIKDNGVGFMDDNITDHTNGLRNMKERLASIGGSCNISGNEGTNIVLIIPLNTYPV